MIWWRLAIVFTTLIAVIQAQDCSPRFVVTSTTIQGKVILTFHKSVSDWKVVLKFSKKVNKFKCLDAKPSSNSGKRIELSAKKGNKKQSKGTVLKIRVQYKYKGAELKLKSIILNGKELCGLAIKLTTPPQSTTTAPQPPTTTVPPPPPTTAVPPPLTTASPRPPTTVTPSTNGPCIPNSKYNYAEVLRKSNLFYEAQRSGELPSSQRITWRKDSALDDAIDSETEARLDLAGGYYDAGDYVKFGFPMAGTLTILAYGGIEYSDVYKSIGEFTYIKDTVKHGADYFMKAHPEPNIFYGQVGHGDTDHAYWGRPEDMTMDRPAYKLTTSKPGSELAGETAAALAAASILFSDTNPTYSAECLRHAKELYNFADKYRGVYSDSIPDAAKYYKNYHGINGVEDELAWAAAWLYYATKDSTYLNAAKSHYSKKSGIPNEFSWDDKYAGVSVLLYKLTKEAQFKTDTEAFCDDMINNRQYTPKGLLFILKWGSLRYAANVAFICLLAADQGLKTNEYLAFGQQQINYMLGDAGHSFVVGFGHNPPQRPHHASSSCPPTPQTCDWSTYPSSEPNYNVLQGALVGGPDQNDNWEDDRTDYIFNEVTCDYNAGFQGAVAALLKNSSCATGPVVTGAPTTAPPPTVAPVTNTPDTPPPTVAPPITSSPCQGSITSNYDYSVVLGKSNLFYEAQRSGVLPASQRVTWRKDSALNDAKDTETGQQIDLEGGFYDAGDYVKFGFPMASTLTILAYGAIEFSDAYKSIGELTYIKDIVKHGADYFMKAHPEPNIFYGQVGHGDTDHAYWGRPEDMTMDRPAYKLTTSKPGSELAGETAAALAAASILFSDTNPTYSAECLRHAKELYNFGDKYRGVYSDSIPDAAKYYKNYHGITGVEDELAWAAAWLYYATKDNTYLNAAKSHYSKKSGIPHEFSWDDKYAGVSVLLYKLTKEAQFKTDTEAFCDDMINNRQYTPKGLLFILKWGSLRYAANVAFICLLAADQGLKTSEYLAFGQQQIDYMLGDAGHSFVVGFGHNPPQRPHHASSSCPPAPQTCDWSTYSSSEPNYNVLEGALVGGPDQNDNWKDDRTDYIFNEVTCDYNAGFQGAVAALLKSSSCTTGPVVTGDPVVTASPTTAPPQTVVPKTTEKPSTGDCSSIFEKTNAWDLNIQGNLKITFPSTVSSWSLTLTYSNPVSNFQVWVAVAESTSGTTITMTNQSYNNNQNAGSKIDIFIWVTYSGAEPLVTSAVLNGNNLC